MEKQVDGAGSTVTDVTEGCTATETGPLVIPCAVTVIVAVPLIGFPDASLPLQTTKVESQTPPQTEPAGEIVAIAVLEELKVNVVVTAPFDEFTAEGVRVNTSPATSEALVGVTSTCATVVFFFEEEDPPPQPATILKRIAVAANLQADRETKVESRALWPLWLRIRWISINIEEFSV